MNQNRILSLCTAFVALLAVASPTWASLPAGTVARNVDRAAQAAVDQWVASLDNAPRIETVQHVGVLGLGSDQRQFATLLSDSLSRNPRLRVVVLRGPAWDAIEQELARQDPDGGWGDIIDKATTAWRQERGNYVLPETALGADALLMGAVRQIDTDWQGARVSLNLRLIRVETREVIAGGAVEGEHILTLPELAFFYKNQLLIVLVALVALALVGGFFRAMRRPR